jgi:septum formation protein
MTVDIYLASASPRRAELLRQIGIRFEPIVTGIVEKPWPGERAAEYVRRLARMKAHRGAELRRDRGLPQRPVLGADTEVVLDGEILGKPLDQTHGTEMLRRLSGRTHQVLTAISLLAQDETYDALSESRVTLAPLTDADIARYWATGEPADKAGGYAVQGRAAVFITRIEGSYSGIVGLPLFELMQLLKRAGQDLSD